MTTQIQEYSATEARLAKLEAQMTVLFDGINAINRSAVETGI